jgi:hypothetical protein
MNSREMAAQHRDKLGLHESGSHGVALGEDAVSVVIRGIRVCGEYSEKNYAAISKRRSN